MKKITMKPHKAGIYCFRDLQLNIAYIGKDSALRDGRRLYDHLRKDKVNDQPFNKILQKNPKNFVYEEVAYCDPFWLDALEQTLINDHKPYLNIVGNEDAKPKRKKGRPKKNS